MVDLAAAYNRRIDGLELIKKISGLFDGMPVILSKAYPAFRLDPKLKAPDCFV